MRMEKREDEREDMKNMDKGVSTDADLPKRTERRVSGESGCGVYSLVFFLDIVKVIYYIAKDDIPWGLSAGGYILLNLGCFILFVIVWGLFSESKH